MVLIELSGETQAQFMSQRLRAEPIETCLARIIAASYKALETRQQTKDETPKAP